MLSPTHYSKIGEKAVRKASKKAVKEFLGGLSAALDLGLIDGTLALARVSVAIELLLHEIEGDTFLDDVRDNSSDPQLDQLLGLKQEQESA